MKPVPILIMISLTLLLLVSLPFLAACGDGGDGTAPPPEPTSVPTPVPEPIPTATPKPTPEPITIGTLVDAEVSKYMVNLLRDPAPVGVFGIEDDQRLIAFDVTQIGVKSGTSYNPLDFAVQDAEGFVYSTELGGTSLDPQFPYGELTEGRTVRGWVPFAIPKDAIVAALYVEATTFGAEVLIADLLLFDALVAYDDNDDGRITCAEAESHKIIPIGRHHPAYKHMDDRNEDGIVCE